MVVTILSAHHCRHKGSFFSLVASPAPILPMLSTCTVFHLVHFVRPAVSVTILRWIDFMHIVPTFVLLLKQWFCVFCLSCWTFRQRNWPIGLPCLSCRHRRFNIWRIFHAVRGRNVLFDTRKFILHFVPKWHIQCAGRPNILLALSFRNA